VFRERAFPAVCFATTVPNSQSHFEPQDFMYARTVPDRASPRLSNRCSDRVYKRSLPADVVSPFLGSRNFENL
jgi:hypothetical protein